MLAPKGCGERERGLDELRVRVLRLRRYGVPIPLNDVLVPGRDAERRDVDVDGSTTWSDCAVPW